ncbi:MAG: heavy-metal-associated domain-containing protein [Burkholderiales bacterium]|jgi:copper chaperone|nr:heavy-metal-associated domain-containing protein [Burkholderiales bacterium]
MHRITLKVGGMTCGGCVASVTRVVRALPGVATADVSLADGSATVEFDPGRTTAEQIKHAIEMAGYQPA